MSFRFNIRLMYNIFQDMQRMFDLQEDNDNLSSKVTLLQAQLRRVKAAKVKAENASNVTPEVSPQRKSLPLSSSKSRKSKSKSPQQKGKRSSQGSSHSSGSQDIVESSQPEVARGTTSGLNRRAVTRRTSSLSRLTAWQTSASTSANQYRPEASPPAEDAVDTRPWTLRRSPRISAARSLYRIAANAEDHLGNVGQEEPVTQTPTRAKTRRSRGNSSGKAGTGLSDEAMKLALKRISESTATTSSSTSKRKRHSKATYVPESTSSSGSSIADQTVIHNQSKLIILSFFIQVMRVVWKQLK